MFLYCQEGDGTNRVTPDLFVAKGLKALPEQTNGILDSRRSTHAALARCTLRAGRGCSGRRLSDQGECSGSELAEHLALGVARLRLQREADVPSSGHDAWLE